MNKKELEKMPLKDAFESVEAIMEQLRDDELSLEDAFAVYKDGMELLKACSEKIDRVEKQVQGIEEDGEVSEF